jgi:outer membrane cobalamin receptor
VTVKGTTLGTLTDAGGRYSLSVPQGMNTLVFSFIGMKTQEVPIQGRTRIDVILVPDLVGLDEVVVTAMGVSREKKSLGYAVQDISSDEIARSGNTNFAVALQGKVAGLDITPTSGMPGASSSIIIRGARSFEGNNQPLYVVDGQPIEGGGVVGSTTGG